jgi:hypothetical protein
VQLGTLDLTLTSTGPLPNFVPEVAIKAIGRHRVTCRSVFAVSSDAAHDRPKRTAVPG